MLKLRLGRRRRLKKQPADRQSKSRRSVRQSTINYADGQEQPVNTELQFARVPGQGSKSAAARHIESEPYGWSTGRAVRSGAGVGRAIGQKRLQGSDFQSEF